MHEITGSKNRNFTKNSNPLPLMSKGEEEQATGGRAGKQRKCIAINAKGGDCWKYCH